MGFFPKAEVYAPCACGSGKKYKFCCLPRDREERQRRERLEEPAFVVDLGELEDIQRIGLRLLERGEARRAMPFFERGIRKAPVIPQFHNNLALAHFLDGDLRKAIETAERVECSLDPGNVFTLGSLVQYYLLAGREAEALQAAARLEKAEPRDSFALHKKCEALARLRRHEQVLAAALAGARLPEGEDGAAFFAGTACANLARYDEARAHLARAKRDPIHGERARRYLERLERGLGPETLEGDWPYLEFAEWITKPLFDRLRTPEKVRTCPGLAEALVVLINDEPEAGLVFLPLLALIGTPRAVEVLRKIAFGTFGTDELRAAALMELVELGEVQPEETTRIWSQGAWNEVQTCRIEVTTEPLYPLPEDLREDMDRFLESLRGRDWAAAEALGRSLLARAPDFPPLLHNLAQAFRAQGRREEAKALLRRALEIDPAYLFAPAALALMDLEQGRLAEARAVLAGVEMPSRAHADAFACFHLAQVEVALAEGNFEGAAAALSIVEDLRKRTGSALPGIGGWKARWIRLMAGKARRQQECDRGGRRGAPRGLHPPPGECAGRGEPPPGGGEARGA